MTTANRGMDWLLDALVGRTAGARHALVLSRDGLKLCLSSGLSTDQGDQLAAVACGIQSLAHGASVEFGDGSGGVRQSMTEFHGGILFIVAAGEGAHLAVIGEEDADAGVIGHAMNELVEQLGAHLRVAPRRPGVLAPSYAAPSYAGRPDPFAVQPDPYAGRSDAASVPAAPDDPDARGKLPA